MMQGILFMPKKIGLWTFVKGIKAFLIKQIELIPQEGENVRTFLNVLEQIIL